MEWTVIVILGSCLAAALAAVVLLARSLARAYADFYAHANQSMSDMSAIAKDHADKVISHSESFLRLREMELNEPPDPPKRETVAARYVNERRPAGGYVPQGDFEEVRG